MRKIKKSIVALACLGLAFTGAGVWQVTSTKTVQAEANPNFACAGASIRLDSNTEDGDDRTGIRFRVKMENETLATATANGGEVRVLVMPTDLLGDGVLDLNDTGARNEALTAWSDFVENDGTPNTSYKQAYAYTYGMTEAEWNRPTTWRAYYMDGETPVYCDPMERSLSEVALSCEQDETETNAERKEKAGNYILTYNFTYDHGVRGTDGEWKTTTTQYRYGTELTELPAAPTLETREDFEFLAWEMTKGADKLKTKGEKTVITGNVTKEAYWLLTGEISLDSPEKVAEYADLSVVYNNKIQDMTTEVLANPTGEGVAFSTNSKTMYRYTQYAHLDWKNIVVNTDLNCRFKGYLTSEVQTSNNGTGVTKAYFETGDTDQQIYRLQNVEFDDFRTQDSAVFAAYGSEADYYELADFVLEHDNAVNVNQTATFEKFQIGAATDYTEMLSGNNTYTDSSWAWLGDTTGFNILTSSIYNNLTATVSDSYVACTATRAKATGEQFFRVMLKESALKAGDKIVVKMKTKAPVFMGIESKGLNTGGSLLVNGGETNFINDSYPNMESVNTNGQFGTVVFTVANDITKYWLIFGACYDQALDVVIESIEVKPSAITTDVPQYLSGANVGAGSVTLDNTGAINQGIITGADNVKYVFEGETAWGGDALTFNFGGITLNEGDKIYLNVDAGAEGAATITVNGNSAYTLEAGATCNQVVFTATESMTLNTLAFHIAESTHTSVDFTLYKLYIERA